MCLHSCGILRASKIEKTQLKIFGKGLRDWDSYREVHTDVAESPPCRYTQNLSPPSLGSASFGATDFA